MKPANHHLLALTVVSGSLLASAPAFAEGLYVGIEAQQTQSYSEGDFCEGSSNCDVEPTGYRVDAGFAFSDAFALEVGYTDSGDTEGGDGIDRVTVSSDIVDVSLIGNLQLSESLSLFGRFGAAFITNNVDAIGESFDNDVTTYVYGVGVKFGWLVAGYDVFSGNELEYGGVSFAEEDIERIYAGLKIGF